jgi:2-oxoglutarate ferredoxin oxidoreductase subunit alpha
MHMFVLGLLCQLYSLDAALARDQIARLFGKTDTQVINSNIALCEAGAAWAAAQLPLQVPHPCDVRPWSRRSSSMDPPPSRWA